MDLEINSTTKTSAVQEKESDLKTLENRLDDLINVLDNFDKVFSELHSNVFKETKRDEPKSDSEKVPQNKIQDLIDKVDRCFEIQKNHRSDFNDFDNLLH